MKQTILILSAFTASLALGDSGRIIGGTEVPKGLRPEVAALKVDSSSCTSTLVGPRVILTASHCVSDKSGKVEIDGNSYGVRLFRSPLYPKIDHDLAVGILDREVPNVDPLSLMGKDPTKGEKVLLFGFGCTQAGGGGGNDGILREGEASLIDATNLDLVTEGAAACFGDSGGPLLAWDLAGLSVVGVQSKGNIKDRTWSTRVNSQESVEFLADIAKQEKVVICGINAACDPTGTGGRAFGFEF